MIKKYTKNKTVFIPTTLASMMFLVGVAGCAHEDVNPRVDIFVRGSQI